MRTKNFLHRELGAERRRMPEASHPKLQDLDRYLQRDLAADEAEALQDHLESCASCVGVLLDLEAFLGAIVEPVTGCMAASASQEPATPSLRLPKVKVLEVERVWQQLRWIVQEGTCRGGGNGLFADALTPQEEVSASARGQRRSGPTNHGHQAGGQGNEEKTRRR